VFSSYQPEQKNNDVHVVMQLGNQSTGGSETTTYKNYSVTKSFMMNQTKSKQGCSKGKRGGGKVAAPSSE